MGPSGNRWIHKLRAYARKFTFANAKWVIFLLLYKVVEDRFLALINAYVDAYASSIPEWLAILVPYAVEYLPAFSWLLVLLTVLLAWRAAGSEAEWVLNSLARLLETELRSGRPSIHQAFLELTDKGMLETPWSPLTNTWEGMHSASSHDLERIAALRYLWDEGHISSVTDEGYGQHRLHASDHAIRVRQAYNRLSRRGN